jgi:hypothetical protein
LPDDLSVYADAGACLATDLPERDSPKRHRAHAARRV